jgi:nitroimidazol reductase NimA-like FMN-containing flavoprotein (pyridoxamine 5'-phosphate oxidase superfamily)
MRTAKSSGCERSAVLIEELDRQSCLDLLSHMHLGRLACCKGMQSYVMPFYFACDANYVYSFSTIGKKIEWMRANPLVCVQADEVVGPQKWTSVIVFGSYEELPNTPEWSKERATAFGLLQRRAMWWEPAYAKKAIEGGVRSPEPLFYRIRIDEITGRRATGEPLFDARRWTANCCESGWLQKILQRLHGEIE